MSALGKLLNRQPRTVEGEFDRTVNLPSEAEDN
jgi:hypothetical protein